MTEISEFDRLFANYLDGTAAQQDVDRLGRLLIEDADSLQRASELSLLHYQIGEIFDEEQFHAFLDHYSGRQRKLPDAILQKFEMRELAESEKKAPIANLWNRRLMWLAIACGLMLCTSLWFHVFRSSSDRISSAQLVVPPNAEVPSESVATITQLSEVVWAQSGNTFVTGEPLPARSRIHLKSGLAKLTFECGAEVVLQGPCDFVVRDEMVGVLHEGKLAANVPRRAFAFAILSPQVDFIDLGTSFGISVDNTGKSELHVFEGEVLYNSSQRREPVSRSAAVHVKANQAVGFSAGDSQTIAFDERLFSPLLKFRKATTSQHLLPVNENLALWLSADTGITSDEQGRVLAWQDIVTDENRSGEDATQSDARARPIRITDAINGRAGVRFDGQSDYLVTTPLETTDNQTVFLVLQFSEGAFSADRKWGGQILNYDGPPGREASNTFAPGILQIGEPLLAEEFQPSLLTGQVFAGFIGSAVVESGRVDAISLGANQPAVVCYEYDYTQGESRLSINGRTYGETRAFAPQALTSRKIIGRHAWKQLFFSGDLGELLIYNEALSDAEVAAVSNYLVNKYRINSSSLATRR